ncbi:LON peptidase substrate-binding domain-containing protein [Denitratisoma sp. agr-D3]
MKITEIALFPLQTVLFPEGTLPLKVFEQRYLDMAKECLRDELPFGVCLIAAGEEVGEPAEPHEVGTLARIVDWDMPQLGLLQLIAVGGERFQIRERWASAKGLLRATVEVLPEQDAAGLAPEHGRLVPLLKRALEEAVSQGYRATEPYRFDDPAWVAWRFCELLPLPVALKQDLLEQDNHHERLEEVFRFCAQRGLLET